MVRNVITKKKINCNRFGIMCTFLRGIIPFQHTYNNNNIESKQYKTMHTTHNTYCTFPDIQVTKVCSTRHTWVLYTYSLVSIFVFRSSNKFTHIRKGICVKSLLTTCTCYYAEQREAFQYRVHYAYACLMYTYACNTYPAHGISCRRLHHTES